MASRMVQLFKDSRFSATMAECNKAVPVSQGMKEAFSTLLGYLTLYTVSLFILSIFIYPDPNEEYSGFFYGRFTGLLHGGLLIPNWLISFFDETRQVKATSYSDWYNYFWWVGAIGNCMLSALMLFVPILIKNKE